MTGFIIGLLIALAVFSMFAMLALTGFRNGDRPGDATVTAALSDPTQPDEPRPVVVATVRNPSDVPVMAGFRLRPSLFEGSMTARVPWRTLGRRYLPRRQGTVGIVPPGGSASFRVLARAKGHRYRLVAVIGQSGRRLRVLTVPVTPSHVTEPGVTSERVP